MALREVREQILLAYNENILDDIEFLLLYDLNKSQNPDFPYWSYNQFDLDTLSDDECMARFRFLKNYIYSLVDIWQLPDVIKCSNEQKINNVEALKIYVSC